MTYRNLVGGQWTDGSSVSLNVNPSDTADVIGEYALATAEDVQTAIGAAERALPAWAATPGYHRFEILDRAGDEVMRRKEELGDLLAR